MKFGFNFGFLGKGGGASGPTPNFCITQGNDGIVTWYGATLTSPSFGTIDPFETALGQIIYALKWKADGDFVMRFGDVGNEPVPDTPNIIIIIGGRIVALQWDESSLWYEGNALTMATELIDAYVFGEEVCGYAQIIPNHFISYDFSITRGQA